MLTPTTAGNRDSPRRPDLTTTSHPAPVTLVQKLAARIGGTGAGPEPCAQRIPVEAYTDQQRFEAERERLFLRQPVIIGHESQIPGPGDAIVQDWLGLPLITLRDKEGQVGTFLNVCRHRGMRLVQEQGQTCLRSLVCPYHQWTYGLDGALRNVPRQESFSNISLAQSGLARMPTEVRHGLIWVQAERDSEMVLDHHLAGLGADLDIFEMADYRFSQQNVRTVNCNWKLIQDAFLDGYHVTRLHKNTVGPFFPDALAESDRVGKHIRSAVARNEIAEAVDLPPSELDLRYHTSFSYTVFPNSVLVFHPDYTSIIKLFPQSPDQTIFAHTVLTPQAPTSDKERDHFRRSFELIDQGVFQAEDIWVSEGAQQGMRSGANTDLLFGGLEQSAIWFHQILERELA
jgi:phenylpropionate dioxygenase-like ring-hydroxylating dioxygenase large terminal subunit